MASRRLLVLAGLALAALVVGLVLLQPWGHWDWRVDDVTGPPRDTQPRTHASGAQQPTLRGEPSQDDRQSEDAPTEVASRTVTVLVLCAGTPDAEGFPQGFITRRAHVGLGPTGPRDRDREVWQWVDDGAAVQMEVPVTGVIRVRCGAAHCWAVDGALPDLPVAREEVTIKLVPACRIDVEVLDASNGLPVLGEKEMYTERLSTGERVAAAQEELRGKGDPPWLPTGDYRLSVTVPGYEPWAASRIRLDHPGARANVTVRLSPTAAAGRLVLDLDPPNGGSREGAWIHAEVSRRQSVGDARWTALLPRTLDEATHAATLTPMAPGDYRVLVWAGRDLVGLVEDVTIHANQVAHAQLRLGPGLLVPLADLPWEPLGFTNSRFPLGFTNSRFIDVSTRNGGLLPVLHFASRMPPTSKSGWLFSKYDFRDERPGKPRMRPKAARMDWVERHAVLGPYPCAAVVVREAIEDTGREHLFTVE